jgi:Pyridine nucleotide-disulphide oxidoreductase, dimerisation domain
MTPSSASSVASAWSATYPGVNGPAACQEVANQRRQSKALGNGAEHKGQSQTGNDCGDKRRIVHSMIPCGSSLARSLPWACFHSLRPSEARHGLSEDQAAALDAGRDTRILMKMVVDGSTGRVVGCYIVGDTAAEVVQAVAIAVKMKATKADFDATFALHPAAAEELVTMRTPTARYVREAAAE